MIVENQSEKKVDYHIDFKLPLVRVTNISINSPEEERRDAIAQFLKNNYFSDKRKFVSNRKQDYCTIYKRHMLFAGETIPNNCLSYKYLHSMLAALVLDFKPADDEMEIITNLRENINKILEFAKNDNEKILKFKGYEKKGVFRSAYREMIRHLLISIKDLPENLDIDSLALSNEYSAFVISKK